LNGRTNFLFLDVLFCFVKISTKIWKKTMLPSPPPKKELVIMDGRVGNLGMFLLRRWNSPIYMHMPCIWTYRYNVKFYIDISYRTRLRIIKKITILKLVGFFPTCVNRTFHHSTAQRQTWGQLLSNVIDYITITSIFKCNRLNYNHFVNVIDYITDYI